MDIHLATSVTSRLLGFKNSRALATFFGLSNVYEDVQRSNLLVITLNTTLLTPMIMSHDGGGMMQQITLHPTS